jgi:hypothetical protein
MSSSSFVWDCAPLDEHNSKWDVIEDNTHVEGSQHFIENSGHFVEERSLIVLNLTSSVVTNRRVMHHSFQRILG